MAARAAGAPTAGLAPPPRGRSAEIDVALAQTVVPRGAVVDGLVVVHVLDAVEVGEVSVAVDCLAETSITREPLLPVFQATARSQERALLPRVRFSAPAVQGAVLDPGEYQFPFALQLPADGPLSVRVDEQRTLADVRYVITAKITKPLSANRTSFTSKIRRCQFTVVRGPPPDPRADAPLCVARDIPVASAPTCGSWMSCLAPKSADLAVSDGSSAAQGVSLEVSVETSALEIGAQCAVNVLARNGSSRVVDRLSACVEETLHAVAADYTSEIRVRSEGHLAARSIRLGPGEERAVKLEVPVHATVGSFQSPSVSVSHAIAVSAFVEGLAMPLRVRVGPIDLFGGSAQSVPLAKPVDDLIAYKPEAAQMRLGDLLEMPTAHEVP